MAAALAACGEAGGGDDDKDNDSGGGGGYTIGLLLPENGTARYESFDRPYIENKIKELCPDCEIKYSNADQDTNSQKQQFDAMLTEGVDAIILDAVDASATATWVEEADASGVPVVAYDRLAQGPISGYVSYDNVRVGELQAQTLLDSLGDEADGARVVMINGSPTDPNSDDFKRGAHSILDDTVEIVYEQDIDGWDAALANEKMTGAIESLGRGDDPGFDAVYVANDGMATGVITALHSAGISGVPVSGQDAEVAALQNILAGDQTFTIYKGLRQEAETTAELTYRLLEGEDISDLATMTVDSPTDEDIPARLFDPVAVTVDNIDETVIADGYHSADELCEGDYAAACEEAGIG